MSISIIIPSLNQYADLHRTLRALVPEKSDCQILVADRGSSDDTCEVVNGLDWATLVEADGVRAKAVNLAVQQARHDLILILFPGSIPIRGWGGALKDAVQQGAEAGYLRVLREHGLQTGAERLSQRLLGGPRTMDGVYISRSLLQKLGGFREVPEFEWLAFTSRVKESGAQIVPLAQELLITDSAGAYRKSWWSETFEDCVEAWKFSQTDGLCPVRARREHTAAVLLSPGVVDAEWGQNRDPDVRAAIGEAGGQLADCLQSFCGATRVACAVVSGGVDASDSGQARIQLEESTPGGRILEILAWAAEQNCQALYLVRPLSPTLDHATLRKLSEGTDCQDAGVLGTHKGEWTAFWLENPAPEQLKSWNGSPDTEALVQALQEAGGRVNRLDAVQGLHDAKDVKELVYRGVLA